MTKPEDYERAFAAVEALSLKEAKAFVNAMSSSLQLTRLRKFNQGRDVYRLTLRCGMTFDAATPGKAVADGLRFDLSIYGLTEQPHEDFDRRPAVVGDFTRQTRRAARKISQHQRGA